MQQQPFRIKHNGRKGMGGGFQEERTVLSAMTHEFNNGGNESLCLVCYSVDQAGVHTILLFFVIRPIHV